MEIFFLVFIIFKFPGLSPPFRKFCVRYCPRDKPFYPRFKACIAASIFQLIPKKKIKEKKIIIFSIKFKILINFVESFDSNTPQRLLHSSFVTEEKNLRLFLQKFDRYDFIPLPKEVSRSDIKTKFMKSSSFGQVFGLFFVVIFTQDKQIESSLYFIGHIPIKQNVL